MSLSLDIFTPAHRNDFLLEAFYSIKNQPYDHWLIHPNNSLTIADIPKVILDDSRTVIVTSDDPPTTNIGALKRICCSVSESDLLLEYDYDDILAPNAVEEIKKAFEENPEVVFVYSDCAHFNDDARRTPRFFGNATATTNEDTLYGWVYYDYQQDGFLYKAAKCPEAIPFHLSIILFSPDHVRSFRKTAYNAIGGYDASLNILDDADLLARLYLHGDFYHLKSCLYMYRVHSSGNTWIERNEAIQKGMIEMQKKYIRPLAEAWARKNNLPMIDFCGGINPKEGYLSVDLQDGNIIADLNQCWPFKTSSVGVIRASDAIEHLKNIVFTMSEIHRVLVPGGYLIADTPSSDGRGSFMDPTHITHINQNSFWYYTRQDQARFIRNTEIRFQEIVLETYFPNEWARINNIPYVRSDLIALKQNGPKIMGAKLI